MTLHYHGTPITPNHILETMAGHSFCVSWARPDQLRRCHEIGQSVMLDNGAFTYWRTGERPDWGDFYTWAEPWLDCPTTWPVIPDVIDGDEDDNRRLVMECPLPAHKMAPVWHLHESLDYLGMLVDGWHRICFGSSGQYAGIGTAAWHRRTQEAFETIMDRKPWVHMLRGMQTLNFGCYPFGSVDSTDIARHHYRGRGDIGHAKVMASTWDAKQCPIRYNPVPQQGALALEFI